MEKHNRMSEQLEHNRNRRKLILGWHILSSMLAQQEQQMPNTMKRPKINQKYKSVLLTGKSVLLEKCLIISNELYMILVTYQKLHVDYLVLRTVDFSQLKNLATSSLYISF